MTLKINGCRGVGKIFNGGEPIVNSPDDALRAYEH